MEKDKIRGEFYEAYFELDALCSAKLGISAGGVEGYTVRLTNTRCAPDREGILGRLTRYRLAKEAIASGSEEERQQISKDDVRWIRSFERKLVSGTDPLSRYLRRSHGRKPSGRLFGLVFSAVLLLGVLAAAYFLGLLKF